MNCPKCGNEMKGNICEHCGCTIVETRPNVPPPVGGFKPPKKKVRPGVAVLVFAIALIAIIGASISSKKGKDESGTAANASGSTSKLEGSKPDSATGEESITYGEGEVFEIGNFKVTIGEKELSEGKEYREASEGSIFVYVPIEIENISDKEEHISSLLMFDAYRDDIATKEDLMAMTAGGYESMNGTIAPGKKVIGALSYQLPQDWVELEINLDANALGFTKKKATIIINND